MAQFRRPRLLLRHRRRFRPLVTEHAELELVRESINSKGVLTEVALERHSRLLENPPGRRIVAVALSMHPVEFQRTEGVLDYGSDRLCRVPLPPEVDGAPVPEFGAPVLFAFEERDPADDFVRLSQDNGEITTTSGGCNPRRCAVLREGWGIASIRAISTRESSR